MKVLMINGSPRENGNTMLALSEMKAVFEKEGIETEVIQIGKKGVRGCIACGSCTYICPAKRPLTQTFKQTKAEILAERRAAAAKAQAEAAKAEAAKAAGGAK